VNFYISKHVTQVRYRFQNQKVSRFGLRN